MAGKTVPQEIQCTIFSRIEQFNQQEMPDECRYVGKFKGLLLYLDRIDYGGRSHPIARLSFTGAIDDWEFAIYKYSSDRYDLEEWMFPGADHLDGTIEGAMRCGMEAYTA